MVLGMELRNRPAFTLVELLVVIAIIAVMLGLLLPAVQKVREAAAKISCSNNLKQIGLGLHAYHDVNERMPPGVTPREPSVSYAYMTWLTRLLPYLEQEPLWQQARSEYDRWPHPFVGGFHTSGRVQIRLFTCPSDGRLSGPQRTHNERVVGLTSYVGVLGRDYMQPTGVLFAKSSVRLTYITDGTSQTLAVGERPPSADFWYGWWYAGVGQHRTGSGDMLLGVEEINDRSRYAAHCERGPYRFSRGSVSEQCDLFHYWSLHSGGGKFVFADGSVRFLRYEASDQMPALASRSGGEVVSLP